MDRCIRLISACAAAALLAGCGGGKGNSAPPPTSFAVTPGDQSLTVTLTGDPSAQYWVFIGRPGTTAANFASTTGAFVFPNIHQPFTISSLSSNNVYYGLANGEDYDVSVNARYNGGPGGDSTQVVRVHPRPAGASWTPGNALQNGNNGAALDDLLAADVGNPLTWNGSYNFWDQITPATFVLAGRNGAAFYSTQNPDGLTFAFNSTSTGLTASGTDLNAIAYDAALGFLAVGTNGAASLSANGVTWTPQTSTATHTLRGVSSTGSS